MMPASAASWPHIVFTMLRWPRIDEVLTGRVLMSIRRRCPHVAWRWPPKLARVGLPTPWPWKLYMAMRRWPLGRDWLVAWSPPAGCYVHEEKVKPLFPAEAPASLASCKQEGA
ncbi:hypothetical protein Dimus_029487 [Dionaea muscipula]